MAVTSFPAGAEHFDAAEFDELVKTHGTPALWRKARKCPCLDPETGQAGINCPHCRLYPGTLYDAGTEIVVSAFGRSRSDHSDTAGTWIDGFTSFTFQSTVTPGHLDQIELTAAVMVIDDEILIRGDTDGLGRSKERLRLRHAIEIEFCEAIIAGNLVQFVRGTDFDVSSDGTITWTNPPADGTQYTLRYTARPIFVAWAPMSRDEGGKRMPYRANCQRLDFFLRPTAGVD